MAKKGFWGKFEDLMDSLPGYIDQEISSVRQSTKGDNSPNININGGDNSINSVGSNNVVSMSGTTSIKQSSMFGSSSSTIVQGGNKIFITTKKGKTTIKVNGKEYVEKV